MKKLLFLLSLCMLFSVAAYSAPIHKYVDTVPITKSVFLTKVREFYSDYNISYSYIKADITDERLSLELLKSSDGIDVLDTVENMAETNENTVAAVNGDFFSYYKGNKGFSLGIEIKDGNLLQSPITPESMATVAYDGENVLMTYLEYVVAAVAPNGEFEIIKHLNKHTDYYGHILMYTHDFNGGFSPAPGGNVVEVVVEDGVVREFRRNMPPVEIPENGCVLVVSEGDSMFFANNFSIGDEIRFDYYITPNLDECITAFGSGAMLVKDGVDVGKVSDYSHAVAGFNPRTALGLDEDGKTLFLVTVDGRQGISKGMRMSHLAELLISLGCHTAVNLDGGGSTKMLASTVWNNELTVANNPTENRKVINAIGLTYEKGDECKVAGLFVKPDKEFVFVGEPVTFEAVLFDEDLIKIDVQEDFEWTCSAGRIEDGMLLTDAGGRITVTVKYEDFTASCAVDVIDSVSGIDNINNMELQIGDEKELEIGVFDASGNYVVVDNFDAFNISVSDENVAVFEDGKIKAVGNGTCCVEIERNGVRCVISVAVGEYTFDYYDGFDELKGKFVSYPDGVKGSYELSEEFAFSGRYSGKLSYDFSENYADTVSETDSVVADSDDEQIVLEVFEEAEAPEKHDITQSAKEEQSGDDESLGEELLREMLSSYREDVSKGAYFVLDKPVYLANDCDAVYLNFFTQKEFKHKLKAQFTDGEGNIAIAEFDGEIVPGEWRGMKASIPESFKRPLKLSRVYVLYTPGEEKDSGDVYLEDLFFLSGEKYKTDGTLLNTYIKSQINSDIVQKIRIGALSQAENKNPLTNYIDIRTKRCVSEVTTGFIISDFSEYSETSDENNLFVSLDTSAGGIRQTYSNQWNMLSKAISETDKQNVFIFSKNSVFGNDEFENKVITDYLSECGKNVFVVTCDDESSYKNIKGVKYFTIDNEPDNVFDMMTSKCYTVLEVSIGSDITFDFLHV